MPGALGSRGGLNAGSCAGQRVPPVGRPGGRPFTGLGPNPPPGSRAPPDAEPRALGPGPGTGGRGPSGLAGPLAAPRALRRGFGGVRVRGRVGA